MRATFFFSSRRRHTRSLCDWSSDVCSSDLVKRQGEQVSGSVGKHFTTTVLGTLGVGDGDAALLTVGRSEERRVGKECRSRWSPDQQEERQGGERRRAADGCLR